MANRMDIELTSARDDETYTWRAAGARQPRGVVPVSLLPPQSKVGDVLRAEVEVEIDGITVVSVLPPKEKNPEANRIEFIGPSRPAAGVTTVLAGRGRRGREGERRERDGRRESERRGRERDGRRESERPGRGEAGRRRPEGARGRGAEEAGRREQPAGRDGTGRPARRTPQRFEPGTAHRDELFASLTPEQRPIAERLAVGGLPAVRKAIADEQQRAREEGRPIVSGDPIVAIAEQLLAGVKAAVWLDRAEAAATRPDEISLRDLRATVVGASPRDDHGRELERQLREALERRVTKLRQDWEQHLVQALDDGRVLQALRLSFKPPEPSARFPGALVPRMAEMAGQAMTEETAPDRWLSLLEAAVQSPVRRQVKPVGLPKDPTGEVERQARAATSRIPALARLVGMAIPPPPQPVPGERPSRPARPPRRRPPAPKPAAGTSGVPGVPPAAEPPEPSAETAPHDASLPSTEQAVEESPAVPADAGALPERAGADEPFAPHAAPVTSEEPGTPEEPDVPEQPVASTEPPAPDEPVASTEPPTPEERVSPEAAPAGEAPAAGGAESEDAVVAEESGQPLDEG